MADKWKKTTVDELKAPQNGSVAIGPFGSRLKSDCYVPTGVPVIRGNNIGDTRELVGKMVYISPQVADGLGNAIVHADDLVFPHRGAIGQVGIVPNDYEGRYALSSSLMKLTCDRTKADPIFLFYFFRSAAGRHELLKNASTVGTPGIGQPLASLKSIQISLPPLSEQKAIAQILGTLDDKIELNRRMNATLEAMARALFKSWFIDFDPVHAKAAGRQPSGMDAATAALFPDSFQKTGTVAIPSGWTQGKISDLAQFGRLSLDPSKFPSEVFDHYSLPSFDEGRIPHVEIGSEIKSNKLLVPENAVLLSKLNPHIPRIWFPKVGSEHRSVCSTEFLVACAKSPISREYLFALFKSPSFSAAYSTLVTGTTGSHQRIKAESVLNLSATIPPEKLVTAFTDFVHPLFNRINDSIAECRTLSALRDTLLPKLLSGDLAVAGGGV